MASDTPRTDALYAQYHPAHGLADSRQAFMAFVEHARSLERRNAELEAVVRDWIGWVDRRHDRECIIAVEQKARALLERKDD